MDQWTEYALFVQIVELGSLNKAAEALNLSNPSVSRRLASLEKRLGARLIERSTRRLFVTEIGQDFYGRCKAALEDMQEAVNAVDATNANPAGVLRVTASISLSLQHLVPLLPGFKQRYPNVRLELVTANRYYDIIDNNIDVAIRTRECEPDSSLVIRRLANTRRVLAAAPSYLLSQGIPVHPRELSEHQLLLYSYHNPNELELRKNNETIAIQTKASINVNDAQVLRASALQGLGILAQPMYVIYEDLVAGRLRLLLTDWELPRLSINIVYQHRQHIPAKARAFIDFLVEDFALQDYEQRWESYITNQGALASALSQTHT
jgi:DNA-binding transcriptional LysR family regulator